MKRNLLALGTILIVSGAAATVSAQGIGTSRGNMSYEVTITNATRGQIMSPPIVVVHDPSIKLFEVGQPASDELAAVAEDADSAGLLALLAGLTGNGVDDYAIADDLVMPGQSVTLEVDAHRSCRALSLVSMLVTTNDAFVGIESTPLNGCGGRTTPARNQRLDLEANAYDAGSEANTESCEHIPGPPCGNPFVRVTDGAEGFVHVHAGVHGIGDLIPAMSDWNNPAAEVTITRR